MVLYLLVVWWCYLITLIVYFQTITFSKGSIHLQSLTLTVIIANTNIVLAILLLLLPDGFQIVHYLSNLHVCYYKVMF